MRFAIPALAAAFLASALAACAERDPSRHAGGPADPAAAVPALVAPPVFDDPTPAAAATAPLPWGAVNRRVTPEVRR